jgi:hypothetical protein
VELVNRNHFWVGRDAVRPLAHLLQAGTPGFVSCQSQSCERLCWSAVRIAATVVTPCRRRQWNAASLPAHAAAWRGLVPRGFAGFHRGVLRRVVKRIRSRPNRSCQLFVRWKKLQRYPAAFLHLAFAPLLSAPLLSAV